MTLRKAEAFCFRAPLDTPVVTSFGRMLERPAVYVRLEDEDGRHGWGEVWCNFPSVGAEHRARLVNDVLAPTLAGTRLDAPGDLWDRLTGLTSILALQSGEPGPFAQAIAGLDIAAWDLFARRRGVPLWQLLGGTSPTIEVYASGINPGGAAKTAERAAAAGHTAFKLKIGFDPAVDAANLHDIRRALPRNLLAVDANQGWSFEDALLQAPRLERFDLMWLEEPVRADTPWDAWHDLKKVISIPLAGGENIAATHLFAEAIAEGVLSVIQPDVAKWGGLTMGAHVARSALDAGRRFCPHYLGGGIGLLASAHLLAGVGGDGRLEMDINPNVLRDLCCGPLRTIRNGTVTLTDEPGLGIEPDLSALAPFRTL